VLSKSNKFVYQIILLQYTGKIFFLLLLSFTDLQLYAQPPATSMSTDFTILRSFKKQQQFWAAGQSIVGHIHITPKDGAYAWFSYCTNGKFTNQLTAAAKSPLTTPQQIAYDNKASMRFQHISMGWKHYLKGTFNSEHTWNLYGYAGLGLMMGRVENIHSVVIDSSDYFIPVLPGKASFKRLTLDLGLGYEIPLGGDFFFYVEARTMIPTTDYPSDHLYINKDAPLTGSGHLGLRILFD
jgi:hypothetical protein